MSFDTVLIANRDDVAPRIQRACRALNLRNVVVHSEADRDAVYVRQADQALCIGPTTPGQSYLNQAAILFAAQVSGAPAIRPGYGFLSENAGFVARVEEARLTLIGPSAACIRTMSDKVAAKRAMRAAGVPCMPGPDSSLPDDPAACWRLRARSATQQSPRPRAAAAACASSTTRRRCPTRSLCRLCAR